MEVISNMVSGRNLFDSAGDDGPTIKAFHCWEINWDAGATTMVGKVQKLGMSPTKLVKKNKRIIAAEMRRVPPTVQGGKETEECLIRVMVSAKSLMKAAAGMPGNAMKSVMPGASAAKEEDDIDIDDDASVSTLGAEAYLPHHDDLGEGGWEAGRVKGFTVPESAGGGSNTIPLAKKWKTKHELPVRDVNIVGHKGTKVSFTAGGRHHGVKHIKFDTETEADAFVELMKILKAGQADRDKQRKLAAMQSLMIDDEDAPLALLIEIVSAWGLAKADAVGGSDPYVKVTMNGKEVHKTKYISGTLEPIWTIKNGSLFVLNTTVKDLFECHDGLKFEVKDYDTVGGSESLGNAVIPPRTMYDADGERMVLPLLPEAGRTSVKVTGFIAIRCRHATEHDLEFMSKLMRGVSKIGDKDPTALATEGGKSDLKSLLTINTKKEKNLEDPSSPTKKYKVRPYYDPNRKAETKWMTHAQIQDEAMKRSTKWLDAGTGDLGRIYLEVIGCDGLPNLDSGGMAGNKTDGYVTVVYEDCVLRTDVISDKLSPRWMPWTKRAFMLRIMHSSSQIFLGVFDHDVGLDDHDSIGRVAIDLSTFHPYTEYVLHYNIYNAEKWSEKKSRGTITVRLMLEYQNERGLILSPLMLPPPSFHVNLPLKKDFHVVRYTATGQMGAKKYGLKQINEYVEELLAYQRVLFYIQDGLKNVVLWRGHHSVTFCVPRLCPFKDIEELGGKKCTRSVAVKLPIRSLLVFIAAVVLVEHPKFLLSFILASIGFCLTGSLDFRRGNPSKWIRCRTYHYYLRTLILGRGVSPPQTIEPYQNAEAFSAFEKDYEERIKTFEEEAEAARLENLKKQEEYQKELAAIGDANIDISTKGGGGGLMGTGVSIDPFQALWVQIQTILEQVITAIRFIRNVVIWEENFVAFWLTTACYLLAIICLFIPWGWLILWTTRIVVWVFLGPWMKLVDIFWHSHFKQWLKNIKEQGEKAQQEQLDELKMQARTAREEAAKLKVLKKAMFGDYISNVPVFKCGRYKDVPLLASEAKPLSASKLKKEREDWNITRVHGQHLEGVMIPTIEDTIHPEGEVEEDEESDFEDSEAKPLVNGKKKPVYSA